jgi:hypothetical protein
LDVFYWQIVHALLHLTTHQAGKFSVDNWKIDGVDLQPDVSSLSIRAAKIGRNEAFKLDGVVIGIGDQSSSKSVGYLLLRPLKFEYILRSLLTEGQEIGGYGVSSLKKVKTSYCRIYSSSIKTPTKK